MIKSLLKETHRRQIAVIASDFDRTLVARHSGGVLRAELVEAFAECISAEFEQFVESAGVPVYVVTFSDATSADWAAKKRGIPRKEVLGGEELVRRVTAFRRRQTWEVEQVFGAYPPNHPGMPDGKTFHLERVREVSGVRKEQILLIDDDIYNCQKAREEGYQALHVSGRQGFRLDSLVWM
ncbi:MAG: uncharacterized protein KVP18_004381 [Porospora cf. gigantea A]|uniref:uncharacterized protein n=1 Tax=Porospora cf. gigantea A TaxID=2853593 RepID=UPI00355A07A2|nr:MAG: hypothetical protein KVP18_004381 [Porospora cf. gigantea A]